MDVEEEIRDIRKWRHDLEGRGVMSLPERVQELERARHTQDMEGVRLETTIHTLTIGFDKVQRAIEGFHSDIKLTRESFTTEIGKIRMYIFTALITLIVSNLIPQEALTALVSGVLTFLK